MQKDTTDELVTACRDGGFCPLGLAIYRKFGNSSMTNPAHTIAASKLALNPQVAYQITSTWDNGERREAVLLTQQLGLL